MMGIVEYALASYVHCESLGIPCTCALHQHVDRWLNVRFATLDYRTEAVKDNQIKVQCVFQEYLNSAEAFSLPIVEPLQIAIHRG